MSNSLFSDLTADHFLSLSGTETPCLEILALSQNQDTVQINIIGQPASGKSTLARTIAHTIHKYTNNEFKVIHLTEDDIKDNTLNGFTEKLVTKAGKSNAILIFDDTSFLKSPLELMNMINHKKSDIAEFSKKHKQKFISILNLYFPPLDLEYLKKSDMNFFTSTNVNQKNDLIELTGPANHIKIKDYQILNKQIFQNTKFDLPLGYSNKNIEFAWRKPFAPALCWNQHSVRLVVYAKVDPINYC